MIAVWKRELGAYFKTTVGYVFLGVFWLAGSILFVARNMAASSGSIQLLFSGLAYLFLLVVPILTMRLLSEEKRNRTDQLLLSVPLSVTSMVIGKYLAAVTVFLIALIGTYGYAIVIFLYGGESVGMVMVHYAGFFLMGSTYIAIGVLASALAENQISAAVITFAINLSIQFLEGINRLSIFASMKWFQAALSWVSISRRYAVFETGVVSLENVTYYILLIAALLLTASIIFEQRRWKRR